MIAVSLLDKQQVGVSLFAPPPREPWSGRKHRVRASGQRDSSANSNSGQVQQDLLINPTSKSSTTASTTIGDKISQDLIPRSSFTGNVQLPISSPTRSRPLVSTISLSNATVAQRRTFRRAKYLGNVSKRDDTGLFFGLFMLLIVPPGAILAVAFFTGYLELLT